MKKQDILTFVGIIAGFATILIGIFTGGGQLGLFFDLTSIFITIGGSFCALLVNYPLSQFKNMLKIISQAFKDFNMSGIDTILKFTDLSRKARREGLLSLEDEIANIDDDYLKKGLQMVVDGIEPETIKEILELEIDEMQNRHETGANMIRSWGSYAPAFGMIGTLIGLIIMLADLQDSSKIASGMAAALLTTMYGALLANLILNPLASNLSYKSEKEVSVREMMLEGILAIQSGVNPRIVEEKLICYLSPTDRQNFQNVKQEEGAVDNG